MTIAEREAQIHRVKATSFQPELDEAREKTLRVAVIDAVKITLYQITLQPLQMLALIPFLECPQDYTLLPREKGAEFKVPRPLGEGLKPFGHKEKGEGRSVDP